MLHRIIKPLIFISGLMLGCCLSYIYFYSDSKPYSDTTLLEEIFKYANSPITDDNNSCEGKPLKTVAAVVSSLLERNAVNKVNMLVYGCDDETCTMSVAECPPWQGEECSTRFLKFNIDNKNNIKADTFTCFDMP